MTVSMRRAALLAFVLIVTGIGIFLVKTIRLDYPLKPDVLATMWDFEIYLEFDGRNEPARIEVFLPTTDVERNFPREQFYNGPFGLSLINDPEMRNRKAVWTYRYPSNRKVLRYTAQTQGENAATPLSSAFRRQTPDVIPFESDLVKRQAFIVWEAALKRRSADDRSFVDLTIQQTFETGAGIEQVADEAAVLMDGSPGIMQRLSLARHTLQSQGIPARIANGVYLTEGRRRVELKHWLEYRVNAEDFRYFPGDEPDRFFTIWYGVKDLVNDSGIQELDVQIALQSHSNAAEDLAASSGGRANAIGRYFSFGALPVTTQLVYKVLVTIPIGITLLVFLRQFVGLRTLGTFMPVLIGIAFRETALLNGLLLFTLLIGLGLAMRFYLERLQLLLVPRLAVVLIFIVVIMAGITIVMARSNQAIGLSISLFPMVILTMTIERMSIVWEEYSGGEAIKQGFGSLAVASGAYLAMTNPQAEYLMYQFPELLLVLMGLCVLMGRYTGLRLSELWRFRELAKDPAPAAEVK